MILEVQHETYLDYTDPVREWMAELRMEPTSDDRQRCHSFHLTVNHPVPINRYVDGFGNRVHHFNLLSPQSQIKILSACIIETDSIRFDPVSSQACYPLELQDAQFEILDYLTLRGPVTPTPLLDPVLEQLKPRPGGRIGLWVFQVAEYLRSEFEYARSVTDSSSPIDVILTEKKGVCQDFTHLMIAILRANGVPTRYVSGYVHRPNKESQSHAWCEFWLPDLGWVGFDPTNATPVNERFVKVAVGRDYTDVPPNKGIFRGNAQEQITVRVATRELSRLPSLSWREQLPPLDAPLTMVQHHLPAEVAAQLNLQQ